VKVRSRTEQYPTTEAGKAILEAVHQHFEPQPHAFENLAADMWKASDRNVTGIDVTRPTRDGGRDAVGTYQVGPAIDPVTIHFALEAKCFRPHGGGVGVKDISRLIGRLKHRDFGVFVTTAHVGDQAYREVREDQHPVVFLTGRDIIDILGRMGLRTLGDVRQYLADRHPIAGTTDAFADADIVIDLPPPVVTDAEITTAVPATTVTS
jgi:hypothetical protein